MRNALHCRGQAHLAQQVLHSHSSALRSAWARTGMSSRASHLNQGRHGACIAVCSEILHKALYRRAKAHFAQQALHSHGRAL